MFKFEFHNRAGTHVTGSSRPGAASLGVASPVRARPACEARAEDLARRVSGGMRVAAIQQPAERAVAIATIRPANVACEGVECGCRCEAFRPLRGLGARTRLGSAAYAAGYGLDAGSAGWQGAISGSLARVARGLRVAMVAVAAVVALVSTTRADIDPLSGIDLVRITHAGNAPWMGDGRPTDVAIGRGQVNYEYSIGRYEVTTSQWVEFFNAAFDRPANDRIPFLSPPTFWGATSAAATTPDGQRWRVPAGNELRPVGGISWRMAAIYCNWLHNGKGMNREAFMDGAYDVSTFGFTTGTRFTDQHAHTPGARYWIPTWDELLKASHFDPNRFGDNQPGWWVWNDASSTFATWGPPGVGEANYGFRFQNGVSTYEIPLGAYATRSPWGLIDAAGATTEWTEEVIDAGGPLYRRVEGSYWGSDTGAGVADSIYAAGGELPHINSLEFGLRIASSVPSPVCAGWLFTLLTILPRRRRPTDRA